LKAQRPPSKRQLQAAATHEQLLQAAREVFEARGFQATSVGAITEQAETAHGTFYLYFRNKEDAFAQVMASVMDELFREATAQWTREPYEGIENAMRGFLRVFTAHKGLWRCLLQGMLQSPAIEQLWLELRRAFIERITRSLARQQEAGEIREFDPVLAANALASMAEWFGFTYFVLNEPAVAGPGSLDGAVRALTDLWYHAVYGVAEHDEPDGRRPAEG
jgi:AcrR family transcriptional regulator